MGHTFCEDCGSTLSEDKAFCGKCGARASGASAALDPAVQPARSDGDAPAESQSETGSPRYRIAWLSALLYLLVFPTLLLPALTYRSDFAWMGVWRLLDAGRTHSMPTSIWWTGFVTSTGLSFVVAAVIVLLVAGLANTMISGARRKTTMVLALLSALGLSFMILGGVYTKYGLVLAVGLGAFAPLLPLGVAVGAAAAPNRGFVTGRVNGLARLTLYILGASVASVGLWVSASYMMSSSYSYAGFDAPVVERIPVVQMSYWAVTPAEETLVVPSSVSFVTADGETLEIVVDDVEGLQTGAANRILYYRSSMKFSDPWDEQELSGPTLVVKEGSVSKNVAPGLTLRVGTSRWYVLRGMSAVEDYPAFRYFMETRPNHEYVFELEELQ